MFLEINLKVNTDESKQLAAILTFFSALSSEKQVLTPSPEPEPKPVKVAKGVKFTEAKPGAPAVEPVADLGPETSVIKIEDIRALLATKVNNHREEIKNKLTELKAANVTALSIENYPAFVEFLDTLK